MMVGQMGRGQGTRDKEPRTGQRTEDGWHALDGQELAL